jgi:UDP-N-acetyl-D-mannosaminuronate dehydrogenase
MTDTIAIVGLGYVGLPLAVAFGKKIKTRELSPWEGPQR